jgi:SAM-dependent methyltransferase
VTIPRLYTDLAAWWPLLSAPANYAEEAEFFRRTLVAASATSIGTVLELGSGGGNNASHLKAHFQMTLVDRSPGMLAHSRSLNPECEHVEGDMRTVRLGRMFDAVFIHDAICYMTTEDDLRAAVTTAYLHCKPGGVALFVPDQVREKFRTQTRTGGDDGDGRGLRYLIWTWDPDPDDTEYVDDFAYLLRVGEHVEAVHDRHVLGLFSRATWMQLIADVGFQPQNLPFEHSELEPGTAEVFLGTKPGS